MANHTRPKLIINCKHIRENYAYLKSYVSPSIAGCVVKDNAYGLGIREIGQVLYQAGCRVFFVAYGCEGAQLRKVAPDAEIYVLQGYGHEEATYFQRNNLRPVLPTVQDALRYFENPRNRLTPAVQVETGLNRLGVHLREVSAIRHLPFSLILSHLACADEPTHSLNIHQLEEFNKFKEFFPNTPFSLSASDGVFLGKTYHFDMVRLGAALYGINTKPYAEKTVKNCITLLAPILQIKTVEAGESVGYGATYTLSEKRKIATVSIGYGDGVFRSFSPTGILHLMYNNRSYPAPIVGRVSMDNITCDVSNIPEAILNQADYLTLIDDSYDLDTFGQACGTIGYEVLSSIGHGPRYIRQYLD